MQNYTVAVVGVGAVGAEMVRVLQQRRFPVKELRLLARSSRDVVIDGERFAVKETTPEAFEGVNIALFAGTEGEKGAAVTFSRAAIDRGAVVIDNGSDFRMDPGVPLVVPEVNGADVERHQGIIANPNCSTIQMVHALKPIHDLSRLCHVVVSTYQSVSGSGGAAVRELEQQVQAVAHQVELPPFTNIPGQLAMNVLAGCWRFREDGFQDEEWKMVKETHKIMHDEGIAVSPTTVRVPVTIGHAESIWLETEAPIGVVRAREALQAMPGITLVDDPAPTAKDRFARTYPTPLAAAGQDPTYVGRIRQDPFNPKALFMFVVADNLRKGAALNAVQIAEELIRRKQI